jgi:hypothetical protein
LCFDEVRGGERRRLTLDKAPVDWDTLPDDRLELLRRVATPVAARALDPAAESTGRRPLEDYSRTRQ